MGHLGPPFRAARIVTVIGHHPINDPVAAARPLPIKALNTA